MAKIVILRVRHAGCHIKGATCGRMPCVLWRASGIEVSCLDSGGQIRCQQRLCVYRNTKKTAQSFVCSLSGEVGHNCARSHGCLASEICVPASVCPCVTEWMKHVLSRCSSLAVAAAALATWDSLRLSTACVVLSQPPHSDWRQTGGLIVSCSCSR